MKYLKIVIIGIIIIYVWSIINDAKKYDANNQNSLVVMLKLVSPNERVQFLNDFEIASDNIRATNLHGLSKEEIHDIAQHRKNILKKQKIVFLKHVIHSLEKTRRESIRLNSNTTGFPQLGTVGKKYSKYELKIKLDNLLQ